MHYSTIKDDDKIPSELVEPNLQRFLMMKLESIAHDSRPKNIERFRNDLQGLNLFVLYACGIHSTLAFGNSYYRLVGLTDEQLIALAKKTFKISDPC